MKYNFALCDDNLGHLDILNMEIGLILNELSLEVKIHKFESATELINQILKDPNQYDVIFLDMEMPAINGLEAGIKIRGINDIVPIIFITGYSAHALNAFEIRAFDYIIKPIKHDKLKKSIEDVINKVNIYREYKYNEDERISISYNKKIYNINQQRIIYIEKIKNKAIIVCDNDIYEIYESLYELKKKLNPDLFIQAHQGYIINSKKIIKYESQLLTLENNYSVPVSKRYVSVIKKIFFESLR